MRQVNLGMIGGGTVGGGVYEAVRRNGALMASRLGVSLNIRRIAVRDLKKARAVNIPASLLTTDWHGVVADPAVNLVVELMGGTTTARQVVLAALKLGKPVVTANKALLSAHGEELFAAAQANGANLYYEASVAGGIPIIKVLREGLIGNRITRLFGIVNGTCNYILTRMKDEGADFAAVLADAQRLGYAETPPDLDIDGHDAAHKTGILASLAHGFWVNPKQIYTEGIRNITRQDIEFATKLGYTIRLLGCVKTANGVRRKKSAIGNRQSAIQVSVYPALVPNSHVLANVNGVFNAVYVRGDVVGDTLYYGRGAGQDATASAVLSDLADAALDLKCGTKNRIPPFIPHERDGAVLPMDDVVSRYYVRLTVEDRPGVFAKIAGILAKANIGISSIIQPEGHDGVTVPVILMIHDAPNAAMRKALAAVAKLSVVKSAPVMIRVESFE
ncbi:MAG: homoserine dehydrogenase [Verrucomicrobia bacterium]|nr:homoserine dehydrogenase [Verrucomicrobiota bacterium]NBU08779.1 homoserine dehydrogenase [Pseudomonadota bacterium]NDA65363.1 homoserine dehydrogenase [Verrucomicrobiota bacterium]NDB75621.1 homoserine dehydrogenase [Verrucomicrobiota bacterium]NDD36836.1 homoserine dehydrogenase [Verrucomicrobiota bacterium]